ncbi:MAG: sel1 repeat family protein [Betaproteobacteria bacterium]|nr:sel1 repeat family protein [Betaproteobacteria bacterium]
MKQKTTLISLLLAMALLLIQGIAIAGVKEEAIQHFKNGQLEKAYPLMKKAAETGDAESQEILGGMYLEGLGTKKDLIEASKWFKKAAEQGQPESQYNTGTFYEDGIGVKKDFKEAFKWYQLAAKQGNPNAEFKMGWCYLKGIGVEKNMDESFKWYLKSAKQGTKEAFFNVGYMYDYGLGTRKNEAEAEKWYKKTISSGSNHPQYNEALYELGYKYIYSSHIEKQPKKGISLIRKAADAGYANAQGALGFEYERGLYLDKDIAKAREWYQKSAAQGNEEAKQRLQNLK